MDTTLLNVRVPPCAHWLIRMGWQLIRVPLLTLLIVLEPIVTGLLMSLALLGMLMTLFYYYIVELPGFPVGLIMSLSIGMAMLLIPYYWLMRLLSNG